MEIVLSISNLGLKTDNIVILLYNHVEIQTHVQESLVVSLVIRQRSKDL